MKGCRTDFTGAQESTYYIYLTCVRDTRLHKQHHAMLAKVGTSASAYRAKALGARSRHLVLSSRAEIWPDPITAAVAAESAGLLGLDRNPALQETVLQLWDLERPSRLHSHV